MGDAVERDRYHQVLKAIEPGCTLRHVWPMTGGVSAEVTALEFDRPDGSTDRAIVRRHGPVDLGRNQSIAADEFRLLEIIRAHGLAAPAPIAVDESCSILPTPYLVIEYVEGEIAADLSSIVGYVDQLAAELVRIHGVQDRPELAFLPRVGSGYGPRPSTLDTGLSEDRIRDALEAAWPRVRCNAPVLVHGDYWPGNVLWRDGRLAAVIDWEDAAIGDPLVDVGNCRLELLWAAGDRAMDAFTDRYRTQTTVDFKRLPYWDLCAALRPCGRLSTWGLDAPTEARMREQHRWFVDQAIDALCTGPAGPGHLLGG